jgi:transcription antitermination factor NusG
MIHIVEVPLFPSYAFVRFDRDRDPWTPINHTRGVSGVITQGSKPTPCEIGAVEALREGEELRRSLSPPGAPYRPGEACEAVLGGGLKVQGVVKSLTADGNGVIMSAMMFGGLRTIRVDISKLRLRNEGRTIN